MPRVGREGLDIAALTLGVQRVEHQRTLARARDAGHDDQLAGRDVEVEVARLFWRAPRMRIVRRASAGTGLESSGIGKTGAGGGAPMCRHGTRCTRAPGTCGSTERSGTSSGCGRYCMENQYIAGAPDGPGNGAEVAFPPAPNPRVS